MYIARQGRRLHKRMYGGCLLHFIIIGSDAVTSGNHRIVIITSARHCCTGGRSFSAQAQLPRYLFSSALLDSCLPISSDADLERCNSGTRCITKNGDNFYLPNIEGFDIIIIILAVSKIADTTLPRARNI